MTFSYINSRNINHVVIYVFRNNTEADKYSMKMAYDNKQLIKRKIYSLQIVNMDDKYIYGLYCKNPIQFTGYL
jgi:hypothetical protein